MQYPIMLKMADGTEKQFWISDEKLQFGSLSDSDRKKIDESVTMEQLDNGMELIADVTLQQDADVVIIDKYADGTPMQLDQVATYAIIEDTANNNIFTLFVSGSKNVHYCWRATTSANKYLYAECYQKRGLWDANFVAPSSLYTSQQKYYSAPDGYTKMPRKSELNHITKVRYYKNSNGGHSITAGSRFVVYGVKA